MRGQNAAASSRGEGESDAYGLRCSQGHSVLGGLGEVGQSAGVGEQRPHRGGAPEVFRTAAGGSGSAGASVGTALSEASACRFLPPCGPSSR
ncbi:hypothetical protein SHJG_5871 [Streptomyces hygroscopicus subsp. jinggangensis 5008]|nr:hypothetical protein SHJG_5871 [Streptomyces hygroscopicus subsp. jinggangensis 5008]AGF65296.1 hypothetical protein SHJGH_5633 [Streptomyces hygroscopicus subsp. jinggangensis TL01]